MFAVSTIPTMPSFVGLSVLKVGSVSVGPCGRRGGVLAEGTKFHFHFSSGSSLMLTL